MNQNTSNLDLEIEWFEKMDNRFVVKFDKVNIPVEMNKTYFDSVLKHLHN